MYARLTAVALSLGGMTGAQADIFLSAPTFGGPGQSTAVCYYSAQGNKSVVISNSIVLSETGSVLPEVTDNCDGLLSGRGCRTVANVASQGAIICQAVIDNGKAARGRVEIRSNTGAILTSEEIR